MLGLYSLLVQFKHYCTYNVTNEHTTLLFSRFSTLDQGKPFKCYLRVFIEIFLPLKQHCRKVIQFNTNSSSLKSVQNPFLLCF